MNEQPGFDPSRKYESAFGKEDAEANGSQNGHEQEGAAPQQEESGEDKDDVRFLQIRWAKLMGVLQEQFGKVPDLESVLFLVGLRELGVGPGKFTKEQKVDLMHIAICAILAPSGYFRLSHLDQDGWPHWEEVKPVPFIDVFAQEVFLKSHIVDYFAGIYDI